MTRDAAVRLAQNHFDSGAFLADLARRVAIRTESQNPESGPALQSYLAEEWMPSLQALGFQGEIHANPVSPYGPLLVASRTESPRLPTVLIYGKKEKTRGT